MNPIERYKELDKIIDDARKEQEALCDMMLETLAPFRKGDIITDGQKIMQVDRVLCFGLYYDDTPNFCVDGWLFKKDGSLGQRGHRVCSDDVRLWHKRPFTIAKATADEVARLEAWRKATNNQ